MSTDAKDWDGLTISKNLKVGVLYAGTRHKDFTLRIGVAGDMPAAQMEHPEGPLQLITLEVFRRQLLSLGAIPREALTTELLREQLWEGDLAILAKADEELEKKLGALSEENSPTGAASSTA